MAETPDVLAWQRRKEMELFEVIESILQQEDLYRMMEVLFAFVASLVANKAATDELRAIVFLIDPKTSTMARIGPNSLAIESVSMHQGIAGEVASTGVAYVGATYQQHEAFDPKVDLHADAQAAADVQEELCLSSIPLFDTSKQATRAVFAVVQVLAREKFSPFHTTLLERIGPILCQCLRKSMEYHDIVLSQRTQAALLHIVSASSNEETILKLIQRVIKGANHIVRCESITLFLVDWPRNELWSLNPSFREANQRIGLDSCLLGVAATSGRMINVKDASSDPQFHPGIDARMGMKVSSALYVPIGIHHGTADAIPPIAILECVNKLKQNEVCEFTSDDECAFEAFASEVAVILRRRSQETEYLKLLVDSTESTHQEKAHSYVNLLEAFTSKPCNVDSHLAGRLNHSFLRTDWTRSPSIPPPLSPNSLPPPTPSSAGAPTVPGWDLDVFNLESEQLLVFAEQMLVDPFIHVTIDREVLQSFLRVVHDHYHPNPFHNFQHGFSVLHVSYRILKDTQAGRVLLPLDRFACLVAGLCHDIDHPGHSNVYEINSNSPLALLHNDDAVLERHHAATTFRLLQDERVNILAGLSNEEFRYTRKAIVQAIIGTDMALHFDTIDSLEKRYIAPESPARCAVTPLTCKTTVPETGPWTVFAKSVDDRLFLVKALVHAADLSAQVFPKFIALKWSNMIAKEFAYQALMESTENLPVTHVHVDDPLLMVESQHFFAARLVAPLWISLVRFFPSLDHCLTNLRGNIAHYEQEILRLKDAKEDSPTNEGQAVPGKTKRTPAKFNSFRNANSRHTNGPRSPPRKALSFSSSEVSDDMGDETVYPLE